jgi:hypothetical protein
MRTHEEVPLMVEYDGDLGATIADAVAGYVGDAVPDGVAVEILTDLEAAGWEIRHPNDSDGGSYAAAAVAGGSVERVRPPARPWDFFRYQRRRDEGGPPHLP